MNFGVAFQLAPLAGEISEAVAIIEGYMNDPEVPKALSLVQRIEADPKVKAALATFEKVSKIIAASNQQELTGVQGGQ